MKQSGQTIPVVLLALGVASAVLAFVALFAAGIGVDMPIHAQAAVQVRQIPGGASLQQAYDAVMGDQELYGILVQQLGDVMHTLFGGGSSYLDFGSLATYRWEGAANILIAVLGAASIATAIGVALRSFLAGAFVWAGTMSLPLYMGMSHVDFKDMPIAVGLTMVASALILTRVAADSWWFVLGYTALGGAGIFCALAARPGSWPLVLTLIIVSVGVYLAYDAVERVLRRSVRPLVVSLGSAALGLALLWLTNPIARISLFQWMADSSGRASQYPTKDLILTAGSQVSSGDIPWWYVPFWVWAQFPVLALFGVVGGFAALMAGLLGVRWGLGRSTSIAVAPVLVQGVVLPVFVVGAGSVLYDGIRHLLFMIPPLLALAGVGIAALASTRPVAVWGKASLAGIAALVIVAANLCADTRWFPYTYAFINPVAGIQKSPPAWTLDYWGVTRLEGVERLRAAGIEPIVATPLELPGSIFGTRPQRDVGESGAETYGTYQFNRYSWQLPPNCKSLFTITRDGLPLGEGGVCQSAAG